MSADRLESLSANVEEDESNQDEGGNYSSCSSSLYDSREDQEIEQLIKEETAKESAHNWWDISYCGVPINMPSFFCGALVFYALTALIKTTLSSEGGLLVRKPPLPRPFFPTTSNINDYYNGSFGRPFDMYNRADISLTFFYASWSLHSKEAKREYIKLSQLLSNTNINVKLNAVNCDTGYCKQLYKVHNYPAILAVMTGGIPVFFEDVPLADRMFSWILRLSRPIHRLNSLEDKNYDDTRYDLIVLAYLKAEASNHSELSREFKVYRAAALKANNPRIGFFYTIDPVLAEKFGIKDHGIFKIGSKTYRIADETLSQAVLDTVNTHLKEIESNLVVPWRTELKESEGLLSTQLFDMVNKSKIGMVLFTSVNGEFGTSENLETLRKIAFEYYKCDESEQVTEDQPSSTVNYEIFTAQCKFKPDVIEKCCREMREHHECSRNKLHSEEQGVSEKNEQHFFGPTCPEFNFLKNSKKFNRKLQLAAAHYLLNVLRIIQDNEDYRIEDFESVESHSLLIRYLLSNNFS
uniref:Thioredoxin domain-containing protein n=1 Tax=Bursaphelenchus xylophilus TaxID=6326 RepID=A0A1I7SV73_BURXY